MIVKLHGVSEFEVDKLELALPCYAWTQKLAEALHSRRHQR